VQAGAAELVGLLNQGDLQPVLCCAKGRGVTGGPPPRIATSNTVSAKETPFMGASQMPLAPLCHIQFKGCAVSGLGSKQVA
jgi:hypothetical protein